MRVAHLIIFAVPAIWLTEAAAQEPTEESLPDVLCEQCPFDAPVRVPAPNEFTPETRRLGVTSVRDMIDQLPNNITSASPVRLVPGVATLRGLNPANGLRTLTLVDSRSVSPTNNAGNESESAATDDDEFSEFRSDSREEESDIVTEADQEQNPPN
jgi:hypothetical protein